MERIALAIMLLLLLAGFLYIFYFLFRLIKGEKYREISRNGVPDKKTENLLSMLGIVFIFAGLFWYFTSYEPAASYSVNSIDMFNEFRANKIQAYDKYVDKFVEVTGKHVGSDVIYKSPVILLQAASLSNSVQCNFPFDRASQAAALELGQTVTLKGRVIGQDGNVVLDKCSVVR